MSKKKKQEKLKAEKTYRIAENILKHIGGKENVLTVMNCATRLKFGLKDNKKADVRGMNEIVPVKGMFYSNNMWQVASGMGAEEICRDVKFMCYNSGEEQENSELKKIILRTLIIIAGAFILLYIFLKLSGYDLSTTDLSDLIIGAYKKIFDNASYIKYKYINKGYIYKVILAAAGGAFVGILIFGITKLVVTEKIEKTDKYINNLNYESDYADKYKCKDIIYAPVRGRVILFKETGVKEFADEVFGKGYAVLPEMSLITSPCDGKVISISKTKNAFAITSDKGAEIVIHIGVDTAAVEKIFNQEIFTTFVSEGDNVKMGVPLAEFDADNLKAAGFDITVFVSIVNSSDYNEVTKASEYAVDQKTFIKLF